ncbi:hypothetical protein FGO68_gene11182 [Halteria grandinella]|uniref:Uncharacterized protein n=1 Tax=Halteria grandinella TaxID=5974 RepID=A0A8J8NZS4_HALGN|nr:hypothetical protein FGO68_gene11182 [Halteria grandinella]
MKPCNIRIKLLVNVISQSHSKFQFTSNHENQIRVQERARSQLGTNREECQVLKRYLKSSLNMRRVLLSYRQFLNQSKE